MPQQDRLENKLSWVYLFNLIFFIIPLFKVSYAIWQYIAMAVALGVFLFCYFWAYRCTRQEMKWPTLAIVVTATLITPLNPGSIAMFSYAGFFVGFANKRNAYLVKLALLIALLIALEWAFELYWPQFLYIGIPIVVGVSFLGWVEQKTLLQRLQQQKSADEIKQLATIVERERIARDLHDILGHTLSTIALKADLAEKLLARERHQDAALQLAELSQVAREALSQVRQSVSGYQHRGLVAEVGTLLSRLRDGGFAVSLEGEMPSLPPRLETALVLALTELVTNILRHSKGDTCTLVFANDNHHLTVRLSDNGTVTHLHEGNGLTGLRQRMAAIGATLEFDCSNGFAANMTIPLKDSTL